MKPRFAIAVILLLVTFGYAQRNAAPKPETIWIGTELQLGMTKENIFAKLRPNYALLQIKTEGDEWLIQQKNDPLVVYGHLGFKNSKLTYISKSWTINIDDGYSVIQALYGALTQLGKEGKHNCYVDTEKQRGPDSELTRIVLLCGGKQLKIVQTDVFSSSAKGKYLDISEALSSEQTR